MCVRARACVRCDVMGFQLVKGWVERECRAIAFGTYRCRCVRM